MHINGNKDFVDKCHGTHLSKHGTNLEQKRNSTIYVEESRKS